MITLTSAEHIYAVLLSHRGRENAITSIGVARELGFADSFERVVRALVQLHGNVDWPGILCATPGEGGGYYFAANLDEVAEYRAHLATLKKAAAAKLKRLDDRVAQEGFALEEAA